MQARTMGELRSGRDVGWKRLFTTLLAALLATSLAGCATLQKGLQTGANDLNSGIATLNHKTAEAAMWPEYETIARIPWPIVAHPNTIGTLVKERFSGQMEILDPAGDYPIHLHGWLDAAFVGTAHLTYPVGPNILLANLYRVRTVSCQDQYYLQIFGQWGGEISMKPFGLCGSAWAVIAVPGGGLEHYGAFWLTQVGVVHPETFGINMLNGSIQRVGDPVDPGRFARFAPKNASPPGLLLDLLE